MRLIQTLLNVSVCTTLCIQSGTCIIALRGSHRERGLLIREMTDVTNPNVSVCLPLHELQLFSLLLKDVFRYGFDLFSGNNLCVGKCSVSKA